MYRISALHAVDFYKTGHPFMLPAGLEELFGNFTPRSDKNARVLPDYDHKVLWINFQPLLQGLLIDLWNETFFHCPKDEVVQKYKRRMDRALGAGAPSVCLIADLWDTGFLPLRIKALPEGSRVDIRVPTYTIKSTMERHAWVEQYVETQMSAEGWMPCVTTGTVAFEYRRLLTRYALSTGGSLDFVLFQGHDFSARGMAGIVSATTSGAAHLMVFRGTDTVSAIDLLEDFYPDPTDPFVGGSIPATEHAVSSSNIINISSNLSKYGNWNGWTKAQLTPRPDAPLLEISETGFLKYMLRVNKPSGLFSYVSDTYDFWAVITTIASFLKSDIMERDGRVVFRPDSGDPVKIVVGDPNAPYGSPEYKGAVQCLWDEFGGTVNSKGYKTIDTHVGLIYGDSISLDRAYQILEGLKQKNFASDNIVFGIGSFTYQFSTRDSFGTAIKATHAMIDGEEHNLFKDPKTDDGVKKSACGLIRIEKENGHYVMYDCQTREQEDAGELQLVFENGKMVKTWTLSEVRARVDEELSKAVPGLKDAYTLVG